MGVVCALKQWSVNTERACLSVCACVCVRVCGSASVWASACVCGGGLPLHEATACGAGLGTPTLLSAFTRARTRTLCTPPNTH